MPPIRPELLDELLKDYKKPDDLLGQDGLLMRVNGHLRFYGIDAVNQSQSGNLVRFDDATAKRTFLTS